MARIAAGLFPYDSRYMEGERRPYRPAVGPDRAPEEIAANAGTLFDPDARLAWHCSGKRNYHSTRNDVMAR